MAVVWGTVKDHEGHISVQSGRAGGTTFHIYFPITRKEAPEAPGTLTVEDYQGRGEKILVIDDVDEQREIASALLSRLGYAVSTAASGREALDHLETKPADLLLLDMIMDPGWDGLETFRKILERHPGQKAIIASGFSETGRVREAQNLGAGLYIKKPYTLAKLGLAVRDELAGQRG
jgi:two-component system cell cycle sensor histidine kinase/response regulator CckA